ncbi:MAG: hypothetical protein HY403_01605 [Elusimicrobia bacterium]|nr:hypothetical protein [Elusimicrobiota bacterium]
MRRLRWTAAVFAAATLAAGAWRVLADPASPAWDDAWYLEISFRLFSALKLGPVPFIGEYASAFRIKAPLLSLLPLPLYALTGADEAVAVWVNLAALGATCAAVHAAARALWPAHPRREAVAALASALTALLPLLYGLSRVFLVEPVLTALVAAAVWRVAAARTDRREGARLGALLGLGLLAKLLFPLYLAGPIWLRRERIRPQLKTILLVAAPLAATWYAFNLPYVLGFAWSAGFGKIAANYSGAAYSLGTRLSDFSAALLGDALSWPLSAAMALCAAAAARRGDVDDGSRLALAWAAPLGVFALGVNPEIRFTAPALPALALLSARAAMSFDSRRARAAAAVLLLGAGTLVFIRRTFLLPAASPAWNREALVAATAAGGGTVAAVALEHPRLNANNLSSLAAARGLPLRFVSLGYAQTSAEAALIRLKDKGADRLIIVSGVPEAELPPFLNRANEGIERALASGRLPAREAGRTSVAPGVSALIYDIGRPTSERRSRAGSAPGR